MPAHLKTIKKKERRSCCHGTWRAWPAELGVTGGDVAGATLPGWLQIVIDDDSNLDNAGATRGFRCLYILASN